MVLHWHSKFFIILVLKKVSVESRVLWAGSQTVLLNWYSQLAHSAGVPFQTVEYCSHPLGAVWRLKPDFRWVFPTVDMLMLWSMRVVLLKNMPALHNIVVCFASYIFCVNRVQFQVVFDFAWNGFCCCMKTCYSTKHVWFPFKIKKSHKLKEKPLWRTGAGKGGGESHRLYSWQRPQCDIRRLARLQDNSSGPCLHTWLT